MDFRPLPRGSLIDAFVAAVLCALGIAEVFAGAAFAENVVPGPLWLDAATVVVATAPLAWRRRAPFLVVVTVMSLLALRALTTEPLEIYALALVGLVAVFSVASYASLRDATLAALVTALSLGIQNLQGSGTEASPDGGSMILFAVVWLVGRAAGVSRERGMAAFRARDEHTAAALASERARIARELHDAVSHSLSMIAVQAGGARNVLATEPHRAEQGLAAIEHAARQGLAEMRSLLGLLGNDSQHEAPALGLDQLDVLVDSVRSAGIKVEVTETGEREGLSRHADATAYRLIQEALTNAVKHAGPCTVHVTLASRPGHLDIDVSDDGNGLAAVDEPTGRGLIGMSERVRFLGGTIEAGPVVTGHGFRVQARLPR
jgi:signal transduction histidine kinase